MMSSLKNDSYTFLNHTMVVWARGDGDPANYCPPSSANTSNPEYLVTPPRFEKTRSSEKCPSHALSHSPSYSQGPTKFDGKLQGKYTWPFSFPFPTEVDIFGAKKGHIVQRTSIPQSFRERGLDFTILYRLKMTISQGIFHKDTQ